MRRALDAVVPKFVRGRQVSEIVPALMLLVVEHQKRRGDGLIPVPAELRAVEIDARLAAGIDLAELAGRCAVI